MSFNSFNSIEMGEINFQGKYSQANGRVYTIVDIPKNCLSGDAKLELIFEKMRAKELPVKVSYLEVD